MNKIAMITIMAITVLVSIVSAELSKSSDNENLILVEINKGWNLVPSYMNLMDVELFAVSMNTRAEDIYFPRQGGGTSPYPGIIYNLGLSGGGLERVEAKFVKSGPYWLNSLSKRYMPSEEYSDLWSNLWVTLVNNPNDLNAADLLFNLNMGGLWIYSNEDLKIVTKHNPQYQYFNYADKAPYNGVKMYKGWNFFSITPDLTNKALQDIEGDCKITKIAIWNNGKQNWELLDYQTITFHDFSVGGVLVLKVADNCKLSSQAIAPPNIPD